MIWIMAGLTPSGGGALPFLDNTWHIAQSHADVNGDGKSDLLWHNDNGTNMEWTTAGLTPGGGDALPNLSTDWVLG